MLDGSFPLISNINILFDFGSDYHFLFTRQLHLIFRIHVTFPTLASSRSGQKDCFYLLILQLKGKAGPGTEWALNAIVYGLVLLPF